jgi:hypothetical protein
MVAVLVGVWSSGVVKAAARPPEPGPPPPR